MEKGVARIKTWVNRDNLIVGCTDAMANLNNFEMKFVCGLKGIGVDVSSPVT